MSLWRELTHGLRVLTKREAADKEVGDEVQHYLDQATAAHVARGLSPSDALRAARLELGNVTTVREEIRSRGWENAVSSLVADLRYAGRLVGVHRRSYSFGAIAATAAADVITGVTSKSTMSRHCSIHASSSAGSSHSIT